jgi:hypothetical protein
MSSSFYNLLADRIYTSEVDLQRLRLLRNRLVSWGGGGKRA